MVHFININFHDMVKPTEHSILLIVLKNGKILLLRRFYGGKEFCEIGRCRN